MRRLPLVCACLAALGALAEAPARRRVLTLPPVTLGPGVPADAASQVAAMLSGQLDREPSLAAAALPAEGAGALEGARREVEAARAAWGRHALVSADEALGRAVRSLTASAGALAGPAELQDALALRALVRRGLGRDLEAAADLAAAVVLAPDRELPLARASAGLGRAAAQAALAARALPSGGVRLESVPEGATALLDGLALGEAPLEVERVPPGEHLWQLRLPQGETVGGLVAVRAAALAQVRGEAPATRPLARLQRALALGRLDAAALAEAGEVARAAGATWLLAGALRRDGEGLALEAFLLTPGADEARRLPVVRFDAQLLSANVALAPLTAELGRRGAEAGAPAQLPLELAVPPAPTLRRVPYPTGAAPTPEPELPEPAPPRRTPLRPSP